MDYEKKYKEALERARQFSEHPLQEDSDSIVEYIFPELAESKDERIRKALIHLVNSNKELSFGIDNYDGIKWSDILAWLEKQGEQSIYKTPSREIILAIWDLGNEWKELTNGCISTEYGTQLDYIQKHWHESEYYLRAKQGEQQKQSLLEISKSTLKESKVWR